VYKSMHGKELYNKMVVDLINIMMGATSNGIGETPVSAVLTLSSQCNKDPDDDNNREVEEVNKEVIS